MFGMDVNDNKKNCADASRQTEYICNVSSDSPGKASIIYRDEILHNVYSADLALPGIGANKYVEISLVVEGGGIHRIFNEALECRAGDIYIINSGVPHEYYAKSENECPEVYTLLFDAKELLQGECGDSESTEFCYGVFRDNLPVSYSMLNSEVFGEVSHIFRLISSELTEKKLEWLSAVKAHLVLLLITLGRYVNLADTVDSVHPKQWGIISAAMREVLEHFSEPDMTLESIAASLYISKSYLSRMFLNVMGEQFADYVRSVRIDHACDLLRNTNLKNKDIVERCGLKDVPSFYRLFKTVKGVTPLQYRLSQYTDKSTHKGEKTMSIIAEISENLQRGKAKIVKALVQQAIDENIPAVQILNEGLLGGMNIIGEKFKNNEVYVPEVLVAARAMSMGMQVLKPLLVEDGVQATGRVCIGTVQGDLHDIGKNLVKMMMEGKGLEVIDLGTDVAPETFIKTAIEQDCKVICCSALLTTTMGCMADVVKLADSEGIHGKVKIMVGGAPVTEAFCKQIGADCYTSDAASAADAAVELCR